MKKYFLTLLLALVLLPLAGRSDQLAWISRADMDKVVKSIQEQIKQADKPYYMVSYCSMCSEDFIEVLEVKEVVTVATPYTDFFEMRVFGKRVLRSSQPILEGEYHEPIAFEAIPENDDSWVLKDVDLAYVYMPLVGNYFRCIGKEFKFECEVTVEWIKIPKSVFNKVEKRKMSVRRSTAKKKKNP